MPIEVDNRGKLFVQMNNLPLCDDTNGVVGIDCVYAAALYDGKTPHYPAKLPGPIYAPNGMYSEEKRKHNPNYVQRGVESVVEEVASPFATDIMA